MLGLEPGASDAQIKKAYRALARRYHPDVSKEPDAERRFKEVGAAFEALQDPRTRARWSADGERGGPTQEELAIFTDAVERAELIWFRVLLPSAFSVRGPAERVAALSRGFLEGTLEDGERWPATTWGRWRAQRWARRVDVLIEYRPTGRPSMALPRAGGAGWQIVLGARTFWQAGVRDPEQLDPAVFEHLSGQLLSVLASEQRLGWLLSDEPDILERARAWDRSRGRRWLARNWHWVFVALVSAALLAFGRWG